MHLMYCDETNFEKKPGNFFVYGAVVIDSDRAFDLSEEIAAIRDRLRVPRDHVLKFNPGPRGFSHQDFIELKRSLIGAAVRHECKLLVNLVLHDVASTPEEARRNGLNTLCYHFDCYLHRVREPGIVILDRFDDKKLDGQLMEKLAVGLTGKLPFSSEMKIKWIVGYHISAIGQSHYCSLVDVLLGSLRFAINAFTEANADHRETSQTLLRQLSPLFFRERGDLVHEISLMFSPKRVRVDGYRERYHRLRDYLSENGIRPEQTLA